MAAPASAPAPSPGPAHSYLKPCCNPNPLPQTCLPFLSHSLIHLGPMGYPSVDSGMKRNLVSKEIQPLYWHLLQLPTFLSIALPFHPKYRASSLPESFLVAMRSGSHWSTTLERLSSREVFCRCPWGKLAGISPSKGKCGPSQPSVVGVEAQERI